MPSPPGREGALEHAWQRQSVWSQAANRLKRSLERTRNLALVLTLAGAVLSAVAVAVSLDSGAGKVIAFVAGAAVALGGFVRGRAGPEAVSDWTRVRSVSEAIKSEVFLYLTRAGDYRDDGRELRLEQQVGKVEGEAGDLLDHTLDVTPSGRQPPAVEGLDSYLELRVADQIDRFYLPRARGLQTKARNVRRAQIVLGVIAALLGAAAGVWGEDSVAVWVPVVTTVTAAVTAHAAGARYDFLLVEYLRTAHELKELRDRRGDAATMTDEQLIRAAEHVISIQNQAWMAKLTSQEHEPAAG